MTQASNHQLMPSQLTWLRENMRLGEQKVFADMEAITNRIKREQQLNRDMYVTSAS